MKENAPSFAVLLCGSLLVSMPVDAQEATTKGRFLTFGVGQRLQYSNNSELNAISLGSTTEAITYLNFGLTTNTGSSSFQLDANLDLRFAAAPPESTPPTGLNNPFLGIRYQTLSASSVFDFNASLRQTTLDQNLSVTDFDVGSGRRGNYLIGSAIGWGKDSPFGYGLSAAYEAIDYIGTSDLGLIDARRFKIGANASLVLSPTTRLTLGVDRSDFKEEGASSGDLKIGGNAGLVVRRANGDVLSPTLFVDNTETGQREGVSAQYQMALPHGSLSFTPGLTRATTGKVYWTSDFQWQQNLPTGNFSAEWSQEVTSQNENNEEILLSDVSFGYAYDVDPLNSLRLNLDWAQQIYTANDDTSSNASFSAVWSRTITKDWNLDLGYIYRISDKSAEDGAQSNTVYLQLNRNFMSKY
ncbi:MAG: hypothetical protein ABIR04_10665 [Cypionkella sp.]